MEAKGRCSATDFNSGIVFSAVYPAIGRFPTEKMQVCVGALTPKVHSLAGRQGRAGSPEGAGFRFFRVPFWGSVNPSPLGDGMRSIRNDANVEVGESYDM